MDLKNKLRTNTATEMAKNVDLYSNLLLNEEEQNRLITFRFMLPFRFPVRQYTKIKLKKYIIIILHQSEKSDIRVSNTEKVFSNIEITTTISQKKIEKYTRNRFMQNNKLLSKIFDDMLSELNRFIKIAMVNKDYINLHPLGLVDIKTIPYYEIYKSSIKEQEILYSGILEASRLKNIKDDLNNETLSHCILQYEFESESKKLEDNPMFDVQYYLRLAQLRQVNEQFNEAILYYNISFEMFITHILKLYYTYYEKKIITKLRIF